MRNKTGLQTVSKPAEKIEFVCKGKKGWQICALGVPNKLKLEKTGAIK